LLGILPFRLRNLKPHARSGLDRGRDDHIDGNPMDSCPCSAQPLGLPTKFGAWRAGDFRGAGRFLGPPLP
jgi:hypothetical protein